MKKMVIGFIMGVFFCGIVGCKTTGYTVRIETEILEYSEISRISAMLASKGYSVEAWEKIRFKDADPNDVSTLLEKKFGREKVIYGVNPNDMKTYFEGRYNEERYWCIGINLFYVKDMSNEVVRHFRVNIYNQFIGGISPEIRTEIDGIGDFLNEELARKVGKENVMIERKDWGPPAYY